MSNVLAGSPEDANYQVLKSAIQAFEPAAAILLSIHTDTSPSTLEMLMREALSSCYRDVLDIASTLGGLDRINQILSSSDVSIRFSYGLATRMQTGDQIKYIEAMGAATHAQLFDQACIGIIDVGRSGSPASLSVQCTYMATAILFSVLRRYQLHIGTTKTQLMCILQGRASEHRWPESDEVAQQREDRQSIFVLQGAEQVRSSAMERALWIRLRLRHQRLSCVVAIALGIVVVFSVMRAQKWVNY